VPQDIHRLRTNPISRLTPSTSHHHHHHHLSTTRKPATMSTHTLPSTSGGTENPLDLAIQIIALLTCTNQTLAVAESLTAGSLMAALTSAPGASAVFRGGVVSYTTELKQHLLHVDGALIAREGAVHPDVAAQMAEGVRRRTTVAGAETTTWGVGTTGVAGPDEQDGKPPGTVYIGVAGPEGARSWGPFRFPGDREMVREAAVGEALARLREVLVERRG